MRWLIGVIGFLLTSTVVGAQPPFRKVVDSSGRFFYTNRSFRAPSDSGQLRGGMPVSYLVRSTSVPRSKFQRYERIIYHLARQHRVSTRLVLSVISVESDFEARALSPKGAIGLMQLLPETARRYGVTNPWDPFENLRAGIAHLAYLLRRYRGNVRLALAAYNAGEQAVDRYGTVPPFPETRRYVRKVLTLYRRASTRIYRFEDERGIVHYSFHPPNGGAVRNIRIIELNLIK